MQNFLGSRQIYVAAMDFGLREINSRFLNSQALQNAIGQARIVKSKFVYIHPGNFNILPKDEFAYDMNGITFIGEGSFEPTGIVTVNNVAYYQGDTNPVDQIGTIVTEIEGIKTSLTNINNHLTTIDADLEAIKKKNADQDQEINDLKLSVVNGKILLADSISYKGIPTAHDATFKVMSDNIRKISSSDGTFKRATFETNGYGGGRVSNPPDATDLPRDHVRDDVLTFPAVGKIATLIESASGKFNFANYSYASGNNSMDFFLEDDAGVTIPVFQIQNDIHATSSGTLGWYITAFRLNFVQRTFDGAYTRESGASGEVRVWDVTLPPNFNVNGVVKFYLVNTVLTWGGSYIRPNNAYITYI